MQDQPDLKGKTGKSSAYEQARLKHNRNAASGYKETDPAAEEAREKAAAERLRAMQTAHKPKSAKRRAHIQRTHEATLERYVELRRLGLSTPAICAKDGFPVASTLRQWLDDQPEYREAAAEAYDDYIRALVEDGVRAETEIDASPGLQKAVKAMETALKHAAKGDPSTHLQAARLWMLHARETAHVKSRRVSAALQIGRQRLPEEWGIDRDQTQEIVMYEVPEARWMADAATCAPGDPDGQGQAAADARGKWERMRDVTPKT